ncbi:hypothetical protein VPHD480_0265 [Vibrio phage D480]
MQITRKWLCCESIKPIIALLTQHNEARTL